MDDRTTFIVGLVCFVTNLVGWIMTIMAEENQKQYWLGLAMLTIPMLVLAWMVVAEIM